MSETCCKCGIRTIFFFWSSTRGFPRKKLIDQYTHGYEQKAILSGRLGLPVCYNCAKKMGYPISKKETIEVKNICLN